LIRIKAGRGRIPDKKLLMLLEGTPMAKSNRQTPDAAASIAEAITQMQKYGLNSMSWMGSEWMEKMSDLGSEALSFLSARVKEDVALQHKLLHCKDMKELQQLQADFIQAAIDQYTEETGKMIELGATMIPAARKSD
jgi:hypothetical protein